MTAALAEEEVLTAAAPVAAAAARRKWESRRDLMEIMTFRVKRRGKGWGKPEGFHDERRGGSRQVTDYGRGLTREDEGMEKRGGQRVWGEGLRIDREGERRSVGGETR